MTKFCLKICRVGGCPAVFCIVAAFFIGTAGAGDEGGDGCEAMVQPADGSVFDNKERASLVIAVGKSCYSVPGTMTRISLELSQGHRRGALSFAWSVESDFVEGQGVDLDFPAWLPDDEYRGDVIIETSQRLSRPVHFWRVSMSEPSIQVVFPVDGFAFGRDSRPWVQVLVSDAMQQEQGVRDIRYTLQVSVNGTHVTTVKSPNGHKVFLPLPLGSHSVCFHVQDVLGRPTEASASVTVNVSDSPADIPPPVGRSKGLVMPLCAASDSCTDDAGCSGHGRCFAGACLCHGDYEGDSCEYFLLSTTRFLPVKDPRSATSRCHKAQHLSSFTASVLSKHAHFQRPTSCDASTMFLQSRSTRGLGLTLRWLGLAMSQAILKEKALVVDGKWAWFDFEGCSDGMQCYFRSNSNCSSQDIWARPSGDDLSHLKEEGVKTIQGIWGDQGNDGEGDAHVMEGYVPSQLGMPQLAVPGGIFWWTSNTLAQVVLPSENLAMMIREAKNCLGWRSPLIGMHVRRGDSCADWSRPAPCKSLSEYFRECRIMSEMYGTKTVFIATDSADVVTRAREELEGMTILSLAGEDREIFHSNLFIEFRMQMSLMDRRAVTESSLLDVMLLSEADYFIGTFSSAFSAVSYELSVASKGYFPPFVSLDIAWRPFLPFEPHPSVSMQNIVRR